MGGGAVGADIFSGNRDALSTPERPAPEFSQVGMDTESAVERGRERGAEQIGNLAETEPTDPRLTNAIGIVTVGATGVTPEREAQMVQQIVTSPTDNRIAEEVAIGAPEVARDGDRMEKEWMDRAREVVKETKNDPNGRLLKVARLREDYMRKRFNRILGERNDA